MEKNNILTPHRISSDNMEAAGLRQLYEEAFPKEERIPYEDLARLMAVMPINMSAWYDGDAFVGLTMVLERPDVCWFWYFAVREDLRGNGYGQQILNAIKELYADRPLILDIESPRQPSGNLPQRRRRYQFYRRNGFVDTGVGRTFESVAYDILLLGGGGFSAATYEALLDDLRRCWDAMPAAQ